MSSGKEYNVRHSNADSRFQGCRPPIAGIAGGRMHWYLPDIVPLGTCIEVRAVV